MSKGVVVITGATGNVGGKIAAQLLASGRPVRALSRGGARLAAVAARGAEPHEGEFTDAAFLDQAFRGADAVFAMVPPDYGAPDPRGYQRAVVEAEVAALRTAGVRRVVALSSIGAQHPAGTGPIAGLHGFEEALKTLGGTEVVALRAGFFMENLLQNIGTIKATGVLATPVAGDVAIPLVATSDIATAAVRQLVAPPASPGFAVRYVLGPRDVSFGEVARVVGAAIGRPELKYVHASDDDARAGLSAAGLSPRVIDLFLEMYHGLGDGLVRPTRPRDADNTSPTTLEEWVRATFAPAYRAVD